MVNDPKHHYSSGVSAIRSALMEEVVRQGISRPLVTASEDSTRPGIPSQVFAIERDGKHVDATFTYEDIRDSADGVPEHVMFKIRDLVSRFLSAT